MLLLLMFVAIRSLRAEPVPAHRRSRNQANRPRCRSMNLELECLRRFQTGPFSKNSQGKIRTQRGNGIGNATPSPNPSRKFKPTTRALQEVEGQRRVVVPQPRPRPRTRTEITRSTPDRRQRPIHPNRTSASSPVLREVAFDHARNVTTSMRKKRVTFGSVSKPPRRPDRNPVNGRKNETVFASSNVQLPQRLKPVHRFVPNKRTSLNEDSGLWEKTP